MTMWTVRLHCATTCFGHVLQSTESTATCNRISQMSVLQAVGNVKCWGGEQGCHEKAATHAFRHGAEVTLCGPKRAAHAASRALPQLHPCTAPPRQHTTCARQRATKQLQAAATIVTKTNLSSSNEVFRALHCRSGLSCAIP